MSISLLGVLPVSALNIGVVAGIPALQSKIEQLSLEIGRLVEAIVAQAKVSLNIPTLPELAASYAIYIRDFALTFDPTNLFNASAGARADILAQLGLVEAEIAIVGEIVATFEAGLDAGNLSLWTYAGRAASFGTELQAQTISGYPDVEADEQIQALIIATEDFTSWGNFSATFNTGTTSLREIDPTSVADLSFEGVFGGGQLNTGVLDLSQPIELYLLELEAIKLNLEFALGITFGLNLPDLDVLLELALDSRSSSSSS
jgi:hypothetical protein